MKPIYVDSECKSQVRKILAAAGISTLPYATGSRSCGVVDAVLDESLDAARAALEAAGYKYGEHTGHFASPWLVAQRRAIVDRWGMR
jgi:hypothetical protein